MIMRVTNPIWLITMTDIMALLLCFFVMIFAMGTYEIKKKDAGETPEKLTHAEKTVEIAGPEPLPMAQYNKGADLQYVASIFKKQKAEAPELKNMSIRTAGDRLVLSFPSSFLFEKNSAALSAKAQKTLGIMASLLTSIDNTIQIVGMADASLATNAKGNANWSLSLMRAVSVGQALKSAGYERKIVTQGRGDSLASAKARDSDRRVDIVLLPYDFTSPASKGIIFIP
ncbi:MAG: OmpA family protein [Alphaproteobacteria bacterium]|nr:OmpA family protein [Alphaproteobacteria bacterium]